MTENQLRYLNYQESVRHNLATEGLTGRDLDERARHNVATEEDTDIANAERERANRTSEVETNRANMAREDETYRHNVADENIRKTSNVLKIPEAAKSVVDLIPKPSIGLKDAITLASLF